MTNVDMKDLIKGSNGILMLSGKLTKIISVTTIYDSKTKDAGIGCRHWKELSGIKTVFIVESEIERYHLEFAGIILGSSIGNQVEVTVENDFENKMHGRRVTRIDDKTIGTRFSVI